MLMAFRLLVVFRMSTLRFTLTILFTLFTSLVGLGLASPLSVERVSILTCGPGENVYELEGHTALRIQLTDGTDLSVNWGVFDFNSPNFLYRFVKGETDYRMAVYPFEYFYNQYRQEGRRVTERQINLDNESKQRLLALIDSTLTQGSPVYRYNYVLDNCATRPIAYLEMATRAPIVLGKDTGISDSTSTFRADMAYYHRNYPWYQFGIDLALGSGIDRVVIPREHIFAPVALDRMLTDAYYVNEGEKIPLAGEPIEILPTTHGGPQGPTPWYLTPMAVCWAFFIIAATIVVVDIKRRKVSRWFHCLYYSVATLAALLLTFLIFVSVHEATSPNWLFLWLNPLVIIGAVGIWLKKLNRTVNWWQIINFVALIALAIIAACGVQRLNPAFWPLIMTDALLAIDWLTISYDKKDI